MSEIGATAEPVGVGGRRLHGALVVLWLYHAVLLVAAIVILYSASFPGIALFPFYGAVAILGVAAVSWCAWAAVSARRRRWSRWLLVAPIAGLVVVGLVATDAPLHARWAASRGAFEAQVANLPPAPNTDEAWTDVDVPSRVGWYDLRNAARVPGGVIFYEATGSGFDDAGFAYLPAGPSASLESGSFENPQFRHLGGPWYAWTASW